MFADPLVSEWFAPGNEILTETSIILPGGGTKRPDRVIIMHDRVVVVDFKFGAEKPDHTQQVSGYRKLLLDMGYKDVEAWLWYVPDNKKIKI
jgi:hypothetical protein